MHKITFYGGENINRSIEKAIETAKEKHNTVEFEFNGVTVQAAPTSNPYLIYRDWSRGMLRPSGTFTVKPFPDELSARDYLKMPN